MIDHEQNAMLERLARKHDLHVFAKDFPLILLAFGRELLQAVQERAVDAIEQKRGVLCQGCLWKKPLVRPQVASSIVGGAGIHTPEGWVCVADLAIEAIRAQTYADLFMRGSR